MNQEKKKQWLKPEVIIISANRSINGGTNSTIHEGAVISGHYHITSNGGTASVSKFNFDQAHS